MVHNTVIDRPKRNQLAEALRHLLSGRMDNLAFDDLDCPGNITHSDDRALFEIFYAVWPHYDDFQPHRLELTDGQRLDFTRCILFLHSDTEFEWPQKRSGFAYCIQRIATQLFGRRVGAAGFAGEMAVWPFYRREDYNQTLQSPRLLRGKI